MASTTNAHPPKPDLEELQAAVADADLRVLLMCLVHLTGNRRWIEAPYLPARDVRLIADPVAGFTPEIQAEIRHTVVSLLTNGAPAPVLDDPGPELVGHMMSVCLGEQVAPEYVPMLREDMGFSSGDVSWTLQPDPPRVSSMSVLIVGAGISGLGLAVKLKQLGIEYTVVEKNSEVGGTWFENRYPGCGVDTPNHFYSYSYAPNHGWKHYFSPRDELQAYVERCATDFGVRSNIRFDTELIAAVWDKDTRRWTATLRTAAGTTELQTSVLVSAIGHFNQPAPVHIEGLENFTGEVFHTARWPDTADLRGKNVAIVGTGASSMQTVPTIADDVSALSIYQRSPQWVRPLPEYNERVKPGTTWLLENVPYYASWNRFTLFWRYGDGLLRFLKKDPDWPHPMRSLNRVNDRHRVEMADYMRIELATRPELFDACLPTYPPYGKRILLDKGWFKALLKPGVELVTTAIDHIEADGVVTVDGTHRKADVLILATGFRVTDLAARLGITGLDGQTLAEAWADDNPAAYLGITVPGFPNFFCMYGPNTNAGHGGSAFFLAECQVRYITGCLVDMVEHDVAAIECRKDSYEEFVHRVDELHEDLIWTHPGMSTYYRNKHGRVVSPMPFRLVDYWTMTHRPNMNDFRLEPV